MKRAAAWAAFTIAAVGPLSILLALWTDLDAWQVIAIWIAVMWFESVDRRHDRWDRLYVWRRDFKRAIARGRASFDAGSVDLGHALGVVLVLGGLIALLGLVGGVETAGL